MTTASIIATNICRPVILDSGSKPPMTKTARIIFRDVQEELTNVLFLFITEFHGKNYKRDRFDMSRREIKLCRVVPRALIDPVNHVYPPCRRCRYAVPCLPRSFGKCYWG